MKSSFLLTIFVNALLHAATADSYSDRVHIKRDALAYANPFPMPSDIPARPSSLKAGETQPPPDGSAKEGVLTCPKRPGKLYTVEKRTCESINCTCKGVKNGKRPICDKPTRFDSDQWAFEYRECMHSCTCEGMLRTVIYAAFPLADVGPGGPAQPGTMEKLKGVFSTQKKNKREAGGGESEDGMQEEFDEEARGDDDWTLYDRDIDEIFDQEYY